MVPQEYLEAIQALTQQYKLKLKSTDFAQLHAQLNKCDYIGTLCWPYDACWSNLLKITAFIIKKKKGKLVFFKYS